MLERLSLLIFFLFLANEAEIDVALLRVDVLSPGVLRSIDTRATYAQGVTERICRLVSMVKGLIAKRTFLQVSKYTNHVGLASQSGS